MQQIKITKSDAGQRLDKYLKRYFSKASSGFIYKMLRKKNITLNKVKSDGTEILKENDIIYTFFSDETFKSFSGIDASNIERKTTDDNKEANNKNANALYIKAYKNIKGISVIFENDDLVFINKPVGVLSQSNEKSNMSVNEWLIGYLLDKGENIEFNKYKPSVCNRIDMNTSGIVMCAKTYAGSRYLFENIKNHKLKKEYLAVVHGKITKGSKLSGYLVKDSRNNKVNIYTDIEKAKQYDYSEINTEYEPVKYNDKYTLLKINLITGKSHQIRAHLSSIGHPLVGDIKYGGKKVDDINYQLLHAYKITFPDDNDGIGVSGQVILCEPPALFDKMLT